MCIRDSDLPEFPLLNTIHGSFIIEENINLPIIRGYENIERVHGDLIIKYEPLEIIRRVESLTFDAFHQLKYVGGQFDFRVRDLDTLDGFTALDKMCIRDRGIIIIGDDNIAHAQYAIIVSKACPCAAIITGLP